MRKEELELRVAKYLKRVNRSEISYPLDKKGTFRIIGCSGDGDFDVDFVKGTFRETIEYAMQQPDFYPAGAKSERGYIVKIEIKNIGGKK